MNELNEAMGSFILALSVAASGFTVIADLTRSPAPSAIGYLEPRSMYVFDGTEGDDLRIKYDRTIHQDFLARFATDVEVLTDDGWAIHCPYSSPWRQYRADRVLTGEVDLKWWTEGACPALSAGIYKICTTWEIKATGAPTVSLCSNAFRIKEAEG